MKKATILLMMLFVSLMSYAQNAPINFESGGQGANWTWTVFENATNPALEIIDNPHSTGINTSIKVAKFTALQAGNPWAGVESAHGVTNLGPFVLDATNSIIKIMVWKSVISDVGIKLVAPTGWAQPEIKVANTLVNQWEELTFNFSGIPNPPVEEGQYDQIVIFPDFNARTQDNIVYFDNITFNAPTGGEAPSVPVGFVASNMIGPNPVGPGQIFLACGPNQVGGSIVYRLFYSKTSEAPADPKTATEYTFGSTAGDGGGNNAFGFVIGGLDENTSYSFWLYQYNTGGSVFSPDAAAASAVSGGGSGTPETPTTAAPTPPARDPGDVISVFSGAYTNVAGTNFNPFWGQSTVISFIEIAGNETLKYASFNYQGTELGSAQDVSAMDKVHIDMWTSDATSVEFFLISPGPAEKAFSLSITPNQWVSYDIPLSHFTGVDLTNVFQLKFAGGNGSPTVYLDNIYFYKSGATPGDTPRNPIDFEAGGYGADWTWSVFENDANPPLEVIDNPYPSGINTSAKVAKFNALQTGNPWAGVESLHGADIGTFTLDETNAIVKIMVWKPVISDVGIKFALPSGEALPEIKVPNTLINQWEELTFDFSARIGHPATIGQDQIIIFPDFDLGGRSQDNIVYFDNITFHPSAGPSDGPSVAAPTPPTREPGNVISIFSDAYTNVPGTNFNPGWGQSTVASIVQIAGNETMKYASFNYQGTELGSAQNLSSMEKVHLDMWTSDATSVEFFLISPGPAEKGFSLSITPNQWVSYDIPLSHFSGVDLTNVFQLKFAGGNGSPTIYLDNIYFYTDGAPLAEPTSAAPTPTQAQANVISLFSDSYTNVTVDTWRTDWSSATYAEITIGGNPTKKYSNLDFVGIETVTNQINISGMTHFHLNVWSPNFTLFGVKLVDFGPNGAYGGGDDTEHQVNFNTPSQGEWLSLNIPMSNFTGLTTRNNLAQIILVGQPTGNAVVYVDNVLFYTIPTSVNDPALIEQFRVFPNPVSAGGPVQIDAQVKQVQIYNSTGNLVKTMNSSVIQTDGLTKGLYILRIQTMDGKMQTTKLLVN